MLLKIFAFFRYYFNAVNHYRIHSPYLTSLYHDVINNDYRISSFEKIETIRKSLLTDKQAINHTGPGEPSRIIKTNTIKEIAAKAVSSPAKCRFLYRLSAWFGADIQIELGTSLGISTMYLAIGNPGSITYTIEGNPEIAQKAGKNFLASEIDNIVSKTGTFDEQLGKLLEKKNHKKLIYIDGHHKSEALKKYLELITSSDPASELLICIDDINWSKDMQSCWKELILQSNYSYKIDLFQLGILIKKQDSHSYPAVSLIPFKYKPGIW